MRCILGDLNEFVWIGVVLIIVADSAQLALAEHVHETCPQRVAHHVDGGAETIPETHPTQSLNEG